MGRQCGLSQFYQVCLCFFFNLLLSQMYDFTSMIFTVPLWGSEVANSKTEMHLTNTAVEVGMQRHLNAMSLLLNARVTLHRQAYATAFRNGCLTWKCDVTTIERDGDLTLLGICYCVWYGKRLSGNHVSGWRHEIPCGIGWSCGLPQC